MSKDADKGGPDRGRTDKLKGKAKEVVGGATGNDSLRRDGKTDQAAGKAKEKGNKAIDETQEALSDDD